MREIKVRMRHRMRVQGIWWSPGLVLTLPAQQARELVRVGAAEFAEPERAVVEAPELRQTRIETR